MTERQFQELMAKLEEIRCGIIDVESVIEVTPGYLQTAFGLIQNDPHSWSTRPCATCDTISAILGEPFGCTLERSKA